MSRTRSVFALLPLVLAALFVGAPVAAAGDGCGAIVDDAQILDAEAVQSAIDNLNRVGADTHLVTAQSLGSYATLDALVDAKWKSCPSWQAADGGRKSNLLVFAVSMDRKLGIFQTRNTPIDDVLREAGGEQRIYSQYMAPKLRDGDFSGAFIAGMDEARSVINGSYRSGDDDNTQTNENTHSGGSGPGGWIVVYVLLAIFVLWALYFIARFVLGILTDQREAARNRENTRLRAVIARRGASSIIEQLRANEGETTRALKVQRYSTVGGPRAAELNQLLATVAKKLAAANRAIDDAEKTGIDLENRSLPIEQYETLVSYYESAHRDAEQARGNNEMIDQICDEIDRELQGIGAEIEAASQRLTQQRASIAALRAEGIRTEDFDAQVRTASGHLMNASERQQDLASLELLRQANEALGQNECDLAALQEQRAELATAIPKLRGRIQEFRGALDEGNSCLTRLSTYAPGSWSSVGDNARTASARIVEAGAALTEAEAQSSMARQEWMRALESVDTGNRLLDEVLSLLAAITLREEEIRAAEQVAPREVETAQAGIKNATSYIASHSPDVKTDLSGRLHEADETLGEARSELSQAQPNYLRVVELARRASSIAGAAEQQARSEHEAAERLRREAAGALRSARTKVEDAQRYINSHHHSGSSARSELSTAESRLRSAQSAGNPQDVLRLARAARQSAESAEQSARRHVQAHEDEERRRLYSTTTAFSAGYAAGSWGSDSSSSYGGGDQGGSSGSW